MTALVFAIHLMALHLDLPWASYLTLPLGAVLIWRWRRSAVYALVFSLALALASGSILLHTTVSLGFEKESVKAIYAKVESDSVIGRWWTDRSTVSLEECFIKGGSAASARGTVSVTYPSGERLYAGDRVLFYGRFTDYGFSAKHYRVVERSSSAQSRSLLFDALEEKILSGKSEEASLSLMLLLGYSDVVDHPLAELARKSGTSYVLALSGMHLSLFAALLRLLLKPLAGERRAKLLSLALVAFYVFLIGPKPSIIRAFILSLVFALAHGRMKGEDALYLCFLIQSVLFPSTVTNLAGTYSYLSLLGIMSVGNALEASVDRLVLLPKVLVSSICAGAGALLFSAPLSYIVFGGYQVSAIFSGYLISLLIYLYMALSLFPFLPGAKTLVYGLIEKAMGLGARFPMAEGPLPYFIVLICVLLILILSAKLAPCGPSDTTA